MKYVLSFLLLALLIGGPAKAQCPNSYLIDTVDISIYGGTAAVGDVNNDGFDDFVISSTTANNNQGAVYVHSGQTGLILYTINGTGHGFGRTVAGVGDINNDNYDDFAVVGNVNGGASVYSGLDGTPFLELPFGTVYDGAGDVNKDGTPDIIIGNPTASRHRCWLLFRRSRPWCSSPPRSRPRSSWTRKHESRVSPQ